MNQNIMQTKRLYYMDSHQKSMTAHVLSCEAVDSNYYITVNQTVFFPEGGGQHGDQGIFILPDKSQVDVLDVKEKDNIIYHICSKPIEAGTEVHGYIDLDLRFTAMQHHSGEHIFSGLMNSHYGCDNVGFHMGQDAVTMDFNRIVTQEEASFIESLANEAIYKNVDIISCFPAKEELEGMQYRSKKELSGDVRIVTIEGYDSCACCAPHVKKTGEIGLIKIMSVQKYKQGSRLSMLCGKKAYENYEAIYEQANGISNLLSVKTDSVLDGVHRLKEENYKLKGELMEFQKELLQMKLQSVRTDSKHLCMIEPPLPSSMLREYCNQLVQSSSGICAVLSGSDSDGYQYVIGSKQIDVREISASLNNEFAGRGGGSKEMVQGAVKGSRELIERFFTNIFSEYV